jgi:hypothetical protein
VGWLEIGEMSLCVAFVGFGAGCGDVDVNDGGGLLSVGSSRST